MYTIWVATPKGGWNCIGFTRSLAAAERWEEAGCHVLGW